MRRRAKRDDNHGEIVQALRQCGCVVVDTAQLGGGVPDICVGVKGSWTWLEIKDGSKPPSARALTEFEAKWFREAQSSGLRAAVVCSPQEALRAVGLMR